MEILVVIAIIIVIAAIALPVIGRIKANSNKVIALNIMKQLGGAAATYAGAHEGQLPDEDASGREDWGTMTTPDQQKAWYNALPTQMGMKSPADYVKEGRTAADGYASNDVRPHRTRACLPWLGSEYTQHQQLSRYPVGLSSFTHPRVCPHSSACARWRTRHA